MRGRQARMLTDVEMPIEQLYIPHDIRCLGARVRDVFISYIPRFCPVGFVDSG